MRPLSSRTLKLPSLVRPGAKENRAALMPLLVFLLALALLSPVSSAAGATCVAPPDGLIAWWPLDEREGTESQDRVKGQNGRHVNGPTPVDGVVGGALSFDGNDDYVVVPDSEDWNVGAGEFTFEFWGSVSRPAHGSQGHPGDVFFSHDEGPFNVPKHFLSLSSTHLQYHVNGPGIGPIFSPQAPFAPEIDRWYHLAMVRSGTDYRIYVDGRLEASGTNAAELPDVDALLTFGRALEPFGGFLDGRLDEISFYRRALDESEIRAIFEAGALGKCKGVRIRTRNLSALQLSVPVSQQLDAVGGTAPFEWAVVDGTLPPGMELSSDGVFSGTPVQLGRFEFSLRIFDAAGTQDEASFEVETLLVRPDPAVRVFKAGTATVPGRTVDYFIVVENLGKFLERDVEVFEFLVPPSFYTFQFASPSPNLVSEVGLFWSLEALEPGERQVVSYSVRLSESIPLGVTINGTACAGGSGSAAGRLRDRARGLRIPECEVFPGCYQMLFDDLTQFGVCSVAEDTCERCQQLPLRGSQVCLALCMAHTERCINALLACQRPDCQPAQCSNPRRNPESGETVCGPCQPGCGCDDTPATGPVDPNEKLVLARRFIRPDQPLVYPIVFENIGNAEALDVFITDMLDPALDLTTLEALTPGADLDPTTRILRWELRGRNLQPGETDNVLFLVRPLPGLPSGTEIRNRAEIQFEIFAPLITPEVVNIIDTSTPECQVEPLPETVFSDRFQVRWQGRDEVGEIESFSVFVTDDGGETFDLLQQTTAEETLFEGQLGGSYGFFCVTKDTVGNAETQALVPEATTRVARAVIDIKPDSQDNRVNPESRGVVAVALLGSEALNVTRVDGESLSFGPGEARLAHRHGPHFEDVNADSFIDLIAHFRTSETGIVAGDSEACLAGEIDGARFGACDSITTTPAR